jgi:[ribosomal protein S5]-alanine N-acetyltransferase
MLIAETPRLVIRHFAAGDAEAMEAVFCDVEIMRYSEDGVEEPEAVRVRISSIIANYPTSCLGTWAIAEKLTRNVIGYVALSPRCNHCSPCEAELGFRLARSHWGRGYATEAARAACSHAFDKLFLVRIVAMIDPNNEASARVAKKVGMTLQGEIMFPGYTHPDHLYAIARRPVIECAERREL